MSRRRTIERSEPASSGAGTFAAPMGEAQMLELPRVVCLDLLAAHRFGRLAVATRDGMPIIRPVNYAFDRTSQSVVFRTSRGSKFHALTHAATAAFEIDGVDEQSRTGWSVIIHGVAEEIVRSDEIVRAEQLSLDPWVPGPDPHWVRIRARTVSGRRVALPESAIPGGYLG